MIGEFLRSLRYYLRRQLRRSRRRDAPSPRAERARLLRRRTMIDNRAFTAQAVLSLALGIGTNTTIYTFVDLVMLRSLPLSDPESLVVLN